MSPILQLRARILISLARILHLILAAPPSVIQTINALVSPIHRFYLVLLAPIAAAAFAITMDFVTILPHLALQTAMLVLEPLVAAAQTEHVYSSMDKKNAC